MQIIPELVRRAQLLALWLVVALGVIVGDQAPVERPRSPAPARAIEWRAIRPLGRRLVAVQLRVIIA